MIPSERPRALFILDVRALNLASKIWKEPKNLSQLLMLCLHQVEIYLDNIDNNNTNNNKQRLSDNPLFLARYL